METETTTTDEQNENAQTEDATGQQPNGGNTGAITFASKDELQKHIDQVLKERLEREAKKREKAREEAERRAREEALREQEKFKELADERERRIAELEPLTEQVEATRAEAERYKGALAQLLEAQRKDLPTPIIALLDKLDPVEQLEWIAANREELTPKQGGTGIPATPKAADGRQLTEQQRRDAQSRTAARYRNRF